MIASYVTNRNAARGITVSRLVRKAAGKRIVVEYLFRRYASLLLGLIAIRYGITLKEGVEHIHSGSINFQIMYPTRFASNPIPKPKPDIERKTQPTKERDLLGS